VRYCYRPGTNGCKTNQSVTDDAIRLAEKYEHFQYLIVVCDAKVRSSKLITLNQQMGSNMNIEGREGAIDKLLEAIQRTELCNNVV